MQVNARLLVLLPQFIFLELHLSDANKGDLVYMVETLGVLYVL